MLETIPLFPLGTTVFPHGRLPLQIFEPRYMDLVSSCLKSDSGFGVVSLLEGSEVIGDTSLYKLSFTQIGTYVKIIDWNTQPNSRLGITVEGIKKFRIVSSYQEKDFLHKAEIEWIPEEALLPLTENSNELVALLAQLTKHPKIAQLNYKIEINDIKTLGFLLAQLLPLDTAIKYKLLSFNDPLYRLQEITDLLEILGR